MPPGIQLPFYTTRVRRAALVTVTKDIWEPLVGRHRAVDNLTIKGLQRMASGGGDVAGLRSHCR